MARLLDDPWLKPWEAELRGRAERAFAAAHRLAQGAPLEDWASAHEYYGLHRRRGGWTFRELAPNATSMWLVGDFSGWKTSPAFELRRIPGTGVWEGSFPSAAIRHGDNYRLEVRWDGGRGERIPAYARHVVQDPETHLFCARVWNPPRKFHWRHAPPPPPEIPLIYEAHVGMASEEPKVATYAEFRDDTLPRIRDAGYNTVQLMGVMEHPYYGSFGYHVGSFFAASSRFGSPDDLKSLVDAAHGMGLRMTMDLVHSHAVKNERDGLGLFDGTPWLYFHAGPRGTHPAWDSRCFDYGKTGVLHFLLSNCRFWLDEYRFDGFRFDGVTSMLYKHHGLGVAFTDYSQYFGDAVDGDAWSYLQMANRVVHAVRLDATTVAEDVSGMPGCASPVGDCGLGFDYRMAMGVPDFWFHLAEKTRDEDWPMGGLCHALSDKRPEEKTVSYVESHDQALVGGKTFFFQLADAAVYTGMGREQRSPEIERAEALHKMARLATLSLNGGAYLTFMGNEFGHPEWIDFPREGNGWDYSHARRQWSLRDDPGLRFKALGDFDRELMRTVAPRCKGGTEFLLADEEAKIAVWLRGDTMFAFNFHPSHSRADFAVAVPPATAWRHLLDTDETRFGGHGRIAPGTLHMPEGVQRGGETVQCIRIYLPARTGAVFGREPHAAPLR